MPATKACRYPRLIALGPLALPGARRARASASGTAGTPAAAPGTDGRYAGADAASLPRFYAPDLPEAAGRSVQLGADEARHAQRALRLRPGDGLELCDGRGRLVRCELVSADKGSATVCALEAPRPVPWHGPRLVLAVGCVTLGGGRADWLVEKATELGAHSLVPLVTERSSAGAGRSKFRTGGKQRGGAAEEEAEGADFRPAGRLARLAAAAMKQAQRAHALALRPPAALAAVTEEIRGGGGGGFALVATGGAPPALAQLHAAAATAGGGAAAWDGRPCWLLVGPEGDFTPAELDALIAAGALPCGLGPHRLRTETAALSLLATAAAFIDAAGGGGGDGSGGGAAAG
ncbi:MAG: Alpha/beta knot methyltransferase [Monoraphidium minutum]|nr:MAG: Alpha/beta knot methyltransferase [Monoraphidium minutum]